MTITHHLDDATLMSFAAGALPDALSAVAAAHVAMCARCRREVASLERVGGALLAQLAPATLDRAEPPSPASPRRAHAAPAGKARRTGKYRGRSPASSRAISTPSAGGRSGSECGIIPCR